MVVAGAISVCDVGVKFEFKYVLVIFRLETVRLLNIAWLLVLVDVRANSGDILALIHDIASGSRC